MWSLVCPLLYETVDHKHRSLVLSFTVTFLDLCDKPEIGFRIWQILSTQSSTILQAGLMGWGRGGSHKDKRRNFFSTFILCMAVVVCVCAYAHARVRHRNAFLPLLYGYQDQMQAITLVATGLTY